ncbi:hypothetical protein ACH427_19205 [Streptomyces sp. NPDC020379]|uniref:hypothetical protein n=1 Tax=Streptomyces sp. NPDC020379 TaxID=3365071 RepID=UPI00378DC729
MNEERMPWYMWLVLAAALTMSAPGEFDLAVVAGWSRSVAWVMPLVVSAYGAVAAYVAAKMPKDAPGRRSAVVGAAGALALALAFQVTAHLMAAGFVQGSAWLVAAVSAAPPVVVAHMMHMPSAARAAKAAVPDTVAGEVATVDEATAKGAADVEPHAGRSADEVAVAAATTAIAPRDPGPDALAVPATAVGPVAAVQGVAADAGGPVEDTLPGLSAVAAQPKVTAGRGRARQIGQGVPEPEHVRAAVAALRASGRPVTGRTVGDHFGVAERTGRRYLGMAA